MPSERIQQHIDRLLGEADEALAKLDWEAVGKCASAVLAFDPNNQDESLVWGYKWSCQSADLLASQYLQFMVNEEDFEWHEMDRSDLPWEASL